MSLPPAKRVPSNATTDGNRVSVRLKPSGRVRSEPSFSILARANRRMDGWSAEGQKDRHVEGRPNAAVPVCVGAATDCRRDAEAGGIDRAGRASTRCECEPGLQVAQAVQARSA